MTLLPFPWQGWSGCLMHPSFISTPSFIMRPNAAVCCTCDAVCSKFTKSYTTHCVHNCVVYFVKDDSCFDRIRTVIIRSSLKTSEDKKMFILYSGPSSYDQLEIRTTWVKTKMLVLTYDQSLELRPACRSRPLELRPAWR
jgi:hypothetical protein